MESRASDGTNGVIVASQQGNSEQLKYLLDNGASVTGTDSAQKTALHYCADNLETQCAEMLLEKDKSILDMKDDQGYTALALAVIAGNMNLLKLLIQEGADIHCIDNEGHKLAHWAAVCGHLKVLEVLIEHKADLSSPDSHQAYPIHYAAQMNGTNAGATDAKLSEKVLKKFIDAHVPMDVSDDAGRQPLLWAACSGNSESCRLLLRAGADINSVDKDGLTALHCAASRGHSECIDVLRKQGASINLVDRNKCTALFYAITLGNKQCTKLLLSAKADPNHVDDRGRNPAHCAAIKGCLDTIKLLEKEKADLWHQNKRGDYPIHEAAQKGHIDVVKYLLRTRNEKDAVNVQNHHGKTLLHIAAATNNLPLLKLIINHECDKNALMKHADKEFTPYDLAVLKGHRDTADYLKAKGALPYADLTNVEKTERPKSGRKQSAVKQTEEQRKSPEDQKSLKGKGKAADETDAKAKADAKAKEDAEKAAAAAAAALAAKEAAEKEKAKKAEAAEKEKKKLEEKKSPEPAKSPEHSVETKEVGVGKETATVGVVTDEIKEGEERKTDTDEKQQSKKQKRDPRASPSSVKTEKSIKSQTVPIYVRNQKVGTRMGAQPTKKPKKVVEEVKREEAVSPDSKGKDKKHAKFDKLTEDYDSGNETDHARSHWKKNKYAPHGPNFVDEIHRSVRRFQNKRNKSRQLQQFKRAQIHTGPMHDIVMFSKMMDNHRKGLDKGEDEDLDLRLQASWDGYLRDQLRFVSHLYDNEAHSPKDIKETAKEHHKMLETEANQRKRDTDLRCNMMEEEEERQRKKKMDMDKEMNKLADQTAKMFDNVRETATASLVSAKTKNKELKEDMVKKRDEKLKTTEDPHEKALLEKQAMADAYSDRQDELDTERREKYRHWNRRKDEEMRRRLLMAYRPYFPNDVFHTGSVCLTGGRVKSAGRLRVDSSSSPRPPRKSTKSPRPASHKSDSTNYSVAQYKLKEDNTKVQMTPYGLRRVRNTERPTYAEVEDDLAEAIFFNRYSNSHEAAANWSRKYDGNIRPRTGLVFVEPRVYEDLVREEKEAKQRVSAQARHQYMNGSIPSTSLPSTSSGQRPLVNGIAN